MRRETPAHYLVLWSIMADKHLSAAAKCVATVLLLKYRNHKTGQCNPSFGEVARLVGRGRRSVISAFAELRAAGWIDWTGTKGGTPSNTNNFQFFLQPQPVSQAALVASTAPVTDTALTGDAHGTQPVSQAAHEPSIEPSRTISAREKLKAGSGSVMVKTDTPLGDLYRRMWAATGQGEPAYSRKTGYYLKPLPPLPAEWSRAA